MSKANAKSTVTKMPSAASGSGTGITGNDQRLLAILDKNQTLPSRQLHTKGKKSKRKAERDNQEKIKENAIKQMEEFVEVMPGLNEIHDKMESSQGLTQDVLKMYEDTLKNYN